ncbi:MAG TPA: hypothetical protein VM389_11310 [Phycisphaerae bacterium]|nr:hypothetical protein [Phycisphaerae bacterium]
MTNWEGIVAEHAGAVWRTAYRLVSNAADADDCMQVAEDWKYVGGGVKLGDGSSPVMWWRPKDAETCRVLYGDLTFKDVAPDNLPATQPAGDE